MTAEIINKIRKRVKQNSPLIHCITNPISITQCANAVLAVGGRPMMAEHPKEVSEITLSANALLLNLGNITDVRMESMLISAEAAKSHNIPCVIDAVGIACSGHRRAYAKKIIDVAKPSLIKGNYSEINALFDDSYCSAGVDADKSLGIAEISRAAASLAKRYNTVILASGKIDVISDGKQVILIKNGSPQLSKITGTGCMLGVLCAVFMSENNGINAAVTACTVLGICGQLAETDKGNGSFFVSLMDKLSVLADSELEKYLDMETEKYEKI